jgi:DNA-binding protein HU-beta
MNKSDLIQTVAEKSGLTKKESTSAVDAIINGISDSLAKGESVQLVGFGTFEVRSYNG